MKVAVTWEMCGYVDIAADTLEEAMDIFQRESDCIKLPADGEYVDGSFQLTTNDPEEMEVITDFQNSRAKQIAKQIQNVVITSLEEEVWIPINRNRQIRVEIISLTDGRTEVVSTLYTAGGKEIITVVCGSFCMQDIEKSIQLLIEYADNENQEIWAAIYARNILYYLAGMKTNPYECNAPEWMDKKIFLLVTYDEAEEEDEEDVLTFELRTDADVLLTDHLPVRELAGERIRDMLASIRDN